MLLEEGSLCWKVVTAPRAAILIDVEAYFDAALEAIGRAQRSIYFLNWAFEPETRFQPRPDGPGKGEETIADVLKRLAKARPDLDIRILCWQSALPVAATQKFFPLLDRKDFADSGVRFVLDGELPLGACHHQKAIIIDNAVAFCGGADIGQDRWDTTAHADDDPRRMKDGRGSGYYDSRHELMSLVDGAAAEALGELFRDRWRRCTGETMPTPEPAPPTAWPPSVAPMFEQARVGLSRTQGAWREHPEVRECEALHLAAIEAAKDCIYMENQYFTSELIAGALARRLAEPEGPVVVLISAGHSPSYFDHLTMDPARNGFIQTLKAADRHGRFQIYSPVTAMGRTIIVHAKVTIIDDTLVRIGSVNINNRSMGLDTECDLSIEAQGPNAIAAIATIGKLRTHLLAHWLGCAEEKVEAAIARDGSIVNGIEFLRASGLCRLRPIPTQRLHPVAAEVTRLHLGDPMGPGDTFRPWKRKGILKRERQSNPGAS